jgi:hypothetical protein
MSAPTPGMRRFVVGLASAAIGLGVFLVIAWLVLWGLEAAGGPDWRMPMSLLQSAAALLLIGSVLRWLTLSPANSTDHGKKDS